MSAPAATLAAYSDAELAAFYNACDPDAAQWRDQLEAEMNRRDNAERARQARRSDPVVTDWTMAAHAQYLDAERECTGNLVRADSPVTDAWQLWSGPERWALAHATEELRSYWLTNPRMTVTAYREQVRDQKEAHASEQAVESDASDRVQQGAAQHTAGNGTEHTVRTGSHTGGRSDGNPGHARPAGRFGRWGRAVNTREIAREELARRAEEIRQAAASTTVAVRDTATVVRQQPPVDGAQVLGYVRAFIDRYARMPSEAAADVAALWAMHAHCREPGGTLVFESTPRLMLLSSEPGSGKSRVLNLVRMLCGGRYGLLTEPTAWALAHITGPEHEAAFVDELDVLLGKGSRREAVRAFLHSGYQRDGVMAHMRGSKTEALATFGPCALAGLDAVRTATGASLEPLLTRSIVIRMHRSPDPVPQLDRTARQAASLLHTAMAAWAAQNRSALEQTPALPDWLANRDGEVWGPLLQVADVAADEWPGRALTAAAELCGAWEQPADDGADFMTELADIAAGW